MKTGNQKALALYSKKELKLMIKGTKQMLEIYTGKRNTDNCSLCNIALLCREESSFNKDAKLVKIFGNQGHCIFCAWYVIEGTHCTHRFKEHIPTIRRYQDQHKRQANIRRKELPNWITILEAELDRRKT